MTKKRWAAVIELKKRHNSINSSNGGNMKVSQVTLDVMITFGDPIVAGVQRPSHDNAKDAETPQEEESIAGNSSAGRVTANSGSVGIAFRHRNNKHQRQT